LAKTLLIQIQKHLKKNQKMADKELDICYGTNLTYLKELHELTWKALEKYIVIDKIRWRNI
jgi:hypothetical protein